MMRTTTCGSNYVNADKMRTTISSNGSNYINSSGLNGGVPTTVKIVNPRENQCTKG